MPGTRSSEAGSTLIETMIALGVLTVGALGMAAVFVQGMQRATSSPGDLLATQKAAEAVENVFSSRDSHTLLWSQIRNVQGVSGSDGGVFLDGAQPMREPGPDGLIGTADDGDIEVAILPGRDQIFGTNDDVTQGLEGFTREIRITQLQADLRVVTVTIRYVSGGSPRTYTLTTYVSNYA